MAGTGLVLGVVMYAIMPLGVGKFATAPWLPGAEIDPLVVVAWVLLFFGPVSAAVSAGCRCHRPVRALPLTEARIRQGIVAGVPVTLVGSLVVCVLGPVTLALLPDAGWLAHLLVYHGQHLTAARAAQRVSFLASNGAPGYFLIWLVFPLLGLGVAAITALVAWGNESARQQGHGPGGGGGRPGPAPVPPPCGGRGRLGRHQAWRRAAVRWSRTLLTGRRWRSRASGGCEPVARPRAPGRHQPSGATFPHGDQPGAPPGCRMAAQLAPSGVAACRPAVHRLESVFQ